MLPDCSGNMKAGGFVLPYLYGSMINICIGLTFQVIIKIICFAKY